MQGLTDNIDGRVRKSPSPIAVANHEEIHNLGREVEHDVLVAVYDGHSVSVAETCPWHATTKYQHRIFAASTCNNIG